MNAVPASIRCRFFSVLVLCVAVSLAGCAVPGPYQSGDSWSLRVVTADGASQAIAYEALLSMPHVALEKARLQHHSGEVEVDDWSGVPLATWFDGTCDVRVCGVDGYERTVPALAVKSAIVATHRSGQPLSERADVGPLRIVAPGVHGGSWVYRLVEVRAVPGEPGQVE